MEDSGGLKVMAYVLYVCGTLLVLGEVVLIPVVLIMWEYASYDPVFQCATAVAVVCIPLTVLAFCRGHYFSRRAEEIDEAARSMKSAQAQSENRTFDAMDAARLIRQSEAGNLVTCPKCRTTQRSDRKVCFECGTALHTEILPVCKQPQVQWEKAAEGARSNSCENVCPKCGAITKSGDAFCDQCGTRLA